MSTSSRRYRPRVPRRPQPADRLGVYLVGDKLRSENLRVLYPSGHDFVLRGCLMLFTNPIYLMVDLAADAILPGGQRVPAGAVVALDPRAVVVALADGRIAYTPREHIGGMSAAMVDWLNQNRDWPARLGRMA